MRKTFKYRIYPTKSQETSLRSQLELCRWVYNQSLDLKKTEWETNHNSISLFDLNKTLTTWKLDKPELKAVHSQVLQNAQERVDLAFKKFFKRCKKATKEKPGYPRFKGKDRYDSITYKQLGFKIHADSTTYFSKIGRVKTIFHRKIQGKVKTCTITKTNTDKWFVCFSCEIEKPKPLSKKSKIVGIDLGCHALVYGSDNTKIMAPKFFRKAEKYLAKVQKKFSKLKKGTKERAKQRKVISKVYERISNKRNDFSHKAANKLIQSYDVICHEDLTIKKMMETKKHSKSIADASWAKLIQMITYKAEEAGRLVIPVNPRNTSQQCSTCGALVPKDSYVRIHHCPHCGLKIDRDYNASLNILRLGLESIEALMPKPPGFCIK